VYKAKFGAKRNLNKEGFNYECCTLRKHFPDLITGIDFWNNFIIAWSGQHLCVFLLDENDLSSSDDVVARKIQL
jgi:hypothetical protein